MMDMFVDGAWVPTASGATDPVTNPTTGAIIDTVPCADASDADQAIRAADVAFKKWRIRSKAERVTIVKACAAAMRAGTTDLADALHAELDRPRARCVAEIMSSAHLIDIYAEGGLRMSAKMPLATGAGEKNLITRDPVGVVIAITPFNFPITLLCFKVGAALVVGRTFEVKPLEDRPMSTLLFAEMLLNAGLPKGCFNVVTGTGPDVGKALVEHPTPRKTAFTGGGSKGKAIAAAGTFKSVTLELGGHCTAIVGMDADLDKTTDAITQHAYVYTVKFCYRVNCAYVELSVYEEFLSRLTTKVSALSLAFTGFNGDLGSLVNEKTFANSIRQSDDARSKGARIQSGYERQTGDGFEGGFYFHPTHIANAIYDMQVLQHETFGPILGICPIDTACEGLDHANNSLYNLAGFIFCRDLAKGMALCDGMETGLIWMKDIQRSSRYTPFGGVKQSGIGREKERWVSKLTSNTRPFICPMRCSSE